MVVIRLARGGTKKRPFYHVVLTNSRNARDGRFIERLGFYNPIAKGEEIKIQLNKDRIDYWVAKGAQPSERIAYLIENFADIAMGKLPEPKKKPKKAKKPAEPPKEKEAKPEPEKPVGATGESPEEKPAEKPVEPPKEEEPKEEKPVEPEPEKPVEEKTEEQPKETEPEEKTE
jgi:small subunit ribosomal protein S16